MEHGRKRWGPEPPSKTMDCSCGGTAKLVKRRSFPFGRNSKGRSTTAYVCKDCKKRTPVVSASRPRRM